MPSAELLQWLSLITMTLPDAPEVGLEAASNHALLKLMRRLLQWLALTLLGKPSPRLWKNEFLSQSAPSPMVCAGARLIHLDSILKLLQKLDDSRLGPSTLASLLHKRMPDALNIALEP